MIVSLITATYNSEKYLRRTVESINFQTYHSIEHIVIDGCSSDATLDIARESIRELTLISEPDEGIYDAWNKGVLIAKGDYVMFCNSDDFLELDAVEKAVRLAIKNPGCIIFGDVMMFEDYVSEKYEAGHFLVKNLYRGFGFRTTTVLFPSTLFKEIGLFDTNYVIAGDTDFLLRAFKQGYDFIKCNHLVWMYSGGLSNSKPLFAYFEYIKALIKYDLFSFKSIIVFIKKAIKNVFF